MKSTKKLLLSTRPLPKAVIEEGVKKNVIIEELSFIHTTPVEDDELFEKIKGLSKQQRTVVFTSMNAVEAVVGQTEIIPDWKIYSIGNTTRKLIEEKWGEEKITATADNAKHLGERLIDDGVKDFVFFCGNKRRDELPNKIRSEGGMVEEVVVYHTEEMPVQLEKEYDGILFYSPSAVESFYKNNKPAKNTVLFVIGKTTAEELRAHKATNIVVGNMTDKVELAKQAIDYLSGTVEWR